MPRSAIRFKELEETSTNVLTGEETTTKVNYRGVYVMDGETVTFRKLDVIYEGDDYVLSSLNAGDGYLILYDSIISRKTITGFTTRLKRQRQNTGSHLTMWILWQ